MPPKPRDTQKQRLYKAEDRIGYRRVSKAAKTHLVDTETAWHGSHPSMAAAQAYVDAVLSARWFQSRWGQKKIEVVHGHGGSHASTWGHTLSVHTDHRKCETSILHEIAHCLTPGYRYADHGPEFAGVLITLIRHQMGKEHADEMKASFREHRVKFNMKAVPAPGSKPVVTKTEKVAKERAAAKAQNAQRLAEQRAAAERDQRRRVGYTGRHEAADVIRANVKTGLFGPSGSKPRTHALATARALEKGPQR